VRKAPRFGDHEKGGSSSFASLWWWDLEKLRAEGKNFKRRGRLYYRRESATLSTYLHTEGEDPREEEGMLSHNSEEETITLESRRGE